MEARDVIALIALGCSLGTGIIGAFVSVAVMWLRAKIRADLAEQVLMLDERYVLRDGIRQRGHWRAQEAA